MTWRVEYKTDSGVNIAREEVADEAAADARINIVKNAATAYVEVGDVQVRRESIALIAKSEVT